MKKLVLGIILFSFWTLSGAKEIDITESKGIDQEIITSILPKTGSQEVDANVTIKAVFNEALNPMFVKQSVSLKRLTDERIKGFFGFGFAKRKGQQSIQGDTAYDASVHMVTFTPDKPLPVGFYEVSFRHLMTQKPGMHMRICPIVYRFYVPEVINGFKLPPEPDEEKNNETLLGIDSNDNGIRDDVERYIIKRYASDPKYPKTKTAIALQYAWASQKVLENPTIESKKHIDDALDCQYYWARKERDKYTQGFTNFKRGLYYSKLKFLTDPELRDHIYNTRERIERKFSFNAALSGNIFDGREESIENCQVDINALGE